MSYTDVHKRRLEITRTHIPQAPPGGMCLEVGWCGLFDEELLDKGWTVHGANWNPDERTGPFNFDVEKPWPIDDGMFQLVIACEILEHLPTDPMALFAEANRVLQVEGQILLTTPNICSARGLEAMLQGYQPYLFCTFPRKPCDRHVIEYDKHMLRLMLRSAGFTTDIWTEDCWGQKPERAMEVLRVHGMPTIDRGDNLFTLSRKIRDVSNRKPDGIYHG